MRAPVIALVAALAWTGHAWAGPRPAHPQPSVASVGSPGEAGAPEDPVRAAAKVRQDDFDRRIARRSAKAIGSVCAGCTGRPAREAADANAASAEDRIVDEADDAPPE